MKTTRYFKDGDCYWKFEPGRRPKRKTGFYSSWEDSFFRGLGEFLRDPGTVVEIGAEEAECLYPAEQSNRTPRATPHLHDSH